MVVRDLGVETNSMPGLRVFHEHTPQASGALVH